MKLIDEAVDSGARKHKACGIVGVSVRTYQRWIENGEVKADARPTAIKPTPTHALSHEERKQVLETLNSSVYKSLPPSQVVPRLADEGRYICSESTMYRILRDKSQQHHRGRSKAPEKKEAQTHVAKAPNQVWCWDITYLRGPVKGLYYYLYLILDVYSRKIVGWEIYEEESADNAAQLLGKASSRERTLRKPIVLHSDNGSPMKGSSMLETMYKLGVVKSYSRPRVSNDNAYAESIFRTCKYRPGYPYKGFEDLQSAREWIHKFATWYNHEHRHSGIKFVTPQQRHKGQDSSVLEQRKRLYEQAKERHPRRWTGSTRDWEPVTEVALNPCE